MSSALPWKYINIFDDPCEYGKYRHGIGILALGDPSSALPADSLREAI